MNIKEKNKEENLILENQHGVTLEEKASFLTRGPGGKWAEGYGGPKNGMPHND